MIAFNDLPANGDCTVTLTGTDSPTGCWEWYDGLSVSNAYIETSVYDAKELLRIENVIKATETMVLIARMFKPMMKSVFLWSVRVIGLRMLFCRSGYLSKRIRAIRKSR